MRISNPKTSTGGPLATTWYVNKRFEGTKEYVLSAVTDLSAYVDQETEAVESRSITRDNTLSGDFRTADAALAAEFRAMDATLSTDFRAGDEALATEFRAADAQLSADFRAGDEALATEFRAMDATLSADYVAADVVLSTDFRAGDSALSAASDLRDSEVISALCRFITGYGEAPTDFVEKYIPTLSSTDPAIYYRPKDHGYAYLDENLKVASELMPDISVMDVNVVDVKDLYNYLQAQGYLTHDATMPSGDRSFYARIQDDPTSTTNIVNIVKDAIEAYIIGNQTKDGTIKAYGQGDVFVVTWFDFANIASFDSAFSNVFSQTFMAGAWICSAETRDKDNDSPRKGLNNTIEFVKISYNQGEIVSVNGIVPGTNGNVLLPLSGIYRVTGGKGLIGAALATNLEKIKDTIVDTEAMKKVTTSGGLVEFLEVADRFVFDDDSHACCYAYATIDEYQTLNIATENLRIALSAAIDAEQARAEAEEAALSSAIDDEELRATTAEAAEVARATGIENAISAAIGEGYTDAATVKMDIDAEETRATTAEATELARATAAETAISAAIGEGYTDAATVKMDIDAEESRATSAETVLTDKVNYLSGVVGVEADLSGVTVTSALLGLKAHTETCATNLVTLSTTINGVGYDTFKVETLTIESGDITTVNDALTSKGMSASAVLYTVAHPDILTDPVYEDDIYNYFGIPKASSDSKIAEIVIDGIKGRVLDIYSVDGDTYEKLDTDVSYTTGLESDGVTPKYTSKITLIGEFTDGSAYSTVLDKLVIRYTNKLTVNLNTPNGLF